MGRRDAVGDREGQLDDESVESLARAAGVHAAPTVEAEQRCAGFWRTAGPSVLELAVEELADARPVRDEAALAELAAPYDEELPVGVDVAEAEAARLPGSEPEAVAEGKDGVVGRAATGGPRIVGKGRGRLEQLTDLGGVEEEGQALSRLPSPGSA